MGKYFCFYHFSYPFDLTFLCFLRKRNNTMLRKPCDVFSPSLSCQVRQEAVAAVKSPLTTEGQSRSVMEEEAACGLLFLTVIKIKKLKRFFVYRCKDILGKWERFGWFSWLQRPILGLRRVPLIFVTWWSGRYRGMESHGGQGLWSVEFAISTEGLSVYLCTKAKSQDTEKGISAPKHSSLMKWNIYSFPKSKFKIVIPKSNCGWRDNPVGSVMNPCNYCLYVFSCFIFYFFLL